MPKINKKPYHIKVELGDKELEKNIEAVLEDYNIDEPFEITEAMKKQPLRYVKWAELLNRAKQYQIKIKRGYEVWYADVWTKFAYNKTQSSGKKPTKDDISNCIIGHFKYKEWQDKLNKAQSTIDTLEVVVKALVMKKEMLVSVGQLCSRLIDSGNLVVKRSR